MTKKCNQFSYFLKSFYHIKCYEPTSSHFRSLHGFEVDITDCRKLIILEMRSLWSTLEFKRYSSCHSSINMGIPNATMIDRITVVKWHTCCKNMLWSHKSVHSLCCNNVITDATDKHGHPQASLMLKPKEHLKCTKVGSWQSNDTMSYLPAFIKTKSD